jgi:transposase-like protein
MSAQDSPKTLLEAVRYFANEDVALAFVANLRWPDGPVCPKCGGKNVGFLSTRRVWKCRAKDCNKQFSVKVGTVFEDSPLPLSKWLPALWMLANCKNGISSYELHRALGVTQKSAWFMLHRLRLAMQSKSFAKMGGTVEVDETYIGGAARNMHAERKKRVIQGRTGMVGKTAVFGLLERHGEDKHSTVRAVVVGNNRKGTLHAHIQENVEPGAEVHSDELRSYRGLEADYTHKVINHAERYVDGQVHTNGMENFWSLLKRGLKGTYISVEPFHLFRYIDEQVHRFNNRKLDDAGRFVKAAIGVIGHRLTYRALIGAKECPTQ